MLWGVTPKGKRMPLDPVGIPVLLEPYLGVGAKQVLPVYNPTTQQLDVSTCFPIEVLPTNDDLVGEYEGTGYPVIHLAYRTHFETCPHADSHRRR